jgi:hypothetical protein
VALTRFTRSGRFSDVHLLLFNSYTSELAWINTVYLIIVYVIVGATAGPLNKARPAATR